MCINTNDYCLLVNSLFFQKSIVHNNSHYLKETGLTFSRLMTYIYIYIYMSYRTANLQMLHFIYLFNRYTY